MEQVDHRDPLALRLGARQSVKKSRSTFNTGGQSVFFFLFVSFFLFSFEFVSTSEVRLVPQRGEGVTTDTKVSGQREQRHKTDELTMEKRIRFLWILNSSIR